MRDVRGFEDLPCSTSELVARVLRFAPAIVPAVAVERAALALERVVPMEGPGPAPVPEREAGLEGTLPPAEDELARPFVVGIPEGGRDVERERVVVPVLVAVACRGTVVFVELAAAVDLVERTGLKVPVGPCRVPLILLLGGVIRCRLCVIE